MATAPVAPTAKPSAPKRSRKKAFVRTEVPLKERIIATGIVCVVAGIGIAIYIKGKHFDPNVYALRTDALQSTASAVDGKASTLHVSADQASPGTPQTHSKNVAQTESAAKASDGESANEGAGEGEDGAGNSAATSAVAAKGKPMDLAIPGIKPMGDTEFYSSDNLFEKIDGRSPAYQSFNVQQLRCRSFAIDGGDGSYVDVYEFLMDTPVNAFGIFALERDPKGKPLTFAPDGYSGEMGFFFRQGARYIQVIASDQKPKTMELAKAIAENRAKAFPEDNQGLDARRRLPAAGMIAGTVSYVQENAQGQPFLKDVFQAAYQFEGKKLPFFVMVTTSDAATNGWKSYQAFSSRFGKAEALPDVNGAKVFRAQSFGSWRVIYQKSGELGGVYDAPDGDAALHFVQQYLQGQIR